MGKTILVVEDKPAITEAVAAKLETEGYEVFAAVNSTEALRVAAKRMPDLVLIDFDLPPRERGAVCLRMHTTPALRHIQTALFTAAQAGRIENLVKDLQWGGYMEKPSERMDILEREREAAGETPAAAGQEAAAEAQQETAPQQQETPEEADAHATVTG